jgi:hypothetical protein
MVYIHSVALDGASVRNSYYAMLSEVYWICGCHNGDYVENKLLECNAV